MIKTHALRCLAVGLVAFGIAGGVSAGQDGASFFANIREAYAGRTAYADVGELEIIEEIDGVESSELHFFETAATRGAGLVWRIMTVSDRGPEDRAVWLAGDAVMIYDGGLRQSKPAPSVAKALEEILGSAAAQAVLVPTLLEFGTGSAALDALAVNASAGDPEPCFADRECRLLSAPLSDGGEIRLQVDIETLWVHGVEVISPRGPVVTTIRVSHSESSLDGSRPEARAAFSPPASTRQVSEWEVAETPAFDAADLEGGFFEVVTVDVFTVAARIVDDFGNPLPNVEPSDLVATIGGREFPVAAVDWYGAPLGPTGPPEPAASEFESEVERLPPAAPEVPAEPELEGRLLVIFLQNDFEPTRIKGQMRLFPGLRRLVDNLAPQDRVAVLSFFAHLKLWQDFTTDRAAVKASLERAFFPGAKPGRVEPSGHPSLLDTFDEDTAREVPNSVEALRYTADTLATLPGEKDIIFFGYGLEGGRVQPMLRALQAARATTFVLDTTQADFHTLGAGLMTMARATGGTYESSYHFAAQALHKIERMITGRYVITIDRSQMPEALGKVSIQLRERPGTVLMTPSGFR